MMIISLLKQLIGDIKMRMLITGSRDYKDKEIIIDAIEKYLGNEYIEDVIIIEGGARGADRIAQQHALDMGYIVETYPANWDKYGKKAGSIRNQEMVDSGADICLAFPLEGSIGTYDCIRRAKKSGIETIII
mgnify:CR=1 FL=1